MDDRRRVGLLLIKGGALLILALQIAEVPDLWAHTSDEPAVLGRYALDYFAFVVAYHLSMIVWAGLVAWLILRTSAKCLENLENTFKRLVAPQWLSWGTMIALWSAVGVFLFLSAGSSISLRTRTMPLVTLAFVSLLLLAHDRLHALDYYELSVPLPHWTGHAVLIAAVVAWLATWMIGLRGGFLGQGYSGTALMLVLIVVVPGWLLSRWLGLHEKVPWPAALALWFALGLTILEIVASLGRLLHLHASFVVLTLAVIEGVLLLASARRLLRGSPGVSDDSASLTIRLEGNAILLSLAALGGLISVVLVADRLAVHTRVPGNDIWSYSTYVSWYLRHPDLPLTPRRVFGGASPRQLSNGWLFANSVMAWAQPVEPAELILALTPILTPVGLAATFLLGYEVSNRETGIALLSVALTTDYYLVGFLELEGGVTNWWVSDHFLYRLGEDKWVAFFILLPVVLSLVYRYVREGNNRLLVPLGLVSMALALTHALGVAAFGICLIGFGLFHTLVAPRKAKIGRLMTVGLLTIPAMGFVAVQGQTVYQALGFDPVRPDGATAYITAYLQQKSVDTDDLPIEVFPSRNIFSAESNRSNYILRDDLLDAPLLRLSLWAAVLLAIGSRQNLSTHLLSGITLFSLFVLYTPGVTPLLGRFTTPTPLWRFLFVIPVGVVLAVALAGVVDYLNDQFGIDRWSLRHSLPSPLVALACAVVCVGLVPQRLQAERAFLLAGAPALDDWDIVAQIDALSGEDPLILAPEHLNGMINGSGVGRVFYLKRYAVPKTYRDWYKNFYDNSSPSASVDQQTLDILREFGFDYLVMPHAHPANSGLLTSSRLFPVVAQNDAYYVYRVREP